ncbi:MAG TPA: iron ABC transporter permease [bacterium]|nr:iron ABC transporter permease [bacterium]
MGAHSERYTKAPLWLALAFLTAFAVVPLAVLAYETVAGPDGFTLAAWRALADDDNLREQAMASLRLGLVATVLSLLLGGGTAWLCTACDLPGRRWFGPLAVAPLVVPPIFVAMGLADLWRDVSGFWPCAILLGTSHAPFVAVLAARGLRAVDGRAYEAALLLRGRAAADRWLLRSIAPELIAGCLLAFLFTVADHGVPEFLTVKGKTWHTYAEGIFSRWSRRAVGTTFAEVQSPIVAALPFLAALVCLLWAALRLRAAAPDRGVRQPLPVQPLGRLRWPALLLPVAYLAMGIGVPVLVLARWALGSAQEREPMGLDYLRESYAKAMDQGFAAFSHSVWLGLGTAAVVVLLALPLARQSARRWPVLDVVAALPAAMPAILLGIALVRTFTGNPVFAWIGGGADGWDFYSGWGFAVCGYAVRLLPFAALTLASQVRRQSLTAEEAGRLVPRSATHRALRLHVAPLLPAAWSAFVLTFVLALRELDLAVMLPAANATAVRRLANAVHFQHEDWSGVIALMLLATAVLLPLLPSLLAGRKLSSLS